MKKGAFVAVQIEKLESIIKKLSDSGHKPSEAAIVSKLLSNLPAKFSLFRMAWNCTPEKTEERTILLHASFKKTKRRRQGALCRKC